MVNKIKKVKPPKAMKVKTLVGRKRGKGEGLINEEGLTKGSGLVTKKVGENLKPVKEIVTGKNIRKTIMANEGSSKNKQGEKTMTKKKYGYGYEDKTNRKDTDSYVSKLKSKEKDTAKASYPKTTGQFNINPNDTLTKISKMTGKSIKDIMAANPDITNPNNIRAGAGLKGLGKRSDYTTTVQNKTKKGTTNIFKVKKGESTTRAADAKARKEAAQKTAGRGLTMKSKPTSTIFRVKKGESTTRARDAKSKKEAAQTKTGRGLTFPSAVKKKADTSLRGVLKRRFDSKIRKEKTEKRRDTRIKNRLLKANELPQGPKRDKAMKEAREYKRRQLNKKPFKITKTKITPLDKFSKGGFVEVRMNTKSKGKGAGASLRGMGAVIK